MNSFVTDGTDNVPYRPIRRRRRRSARWLVALTLAAVIGLLWFDLARPGVIGNHSILALLFPLFVCVLISPFPVYVWLSKRELSYYDERKRAAIAAAAARAYTVFFFLVVFGASYIGLALGNNWPAPVSEHAWSALGRAIVGIGWILPTLFAEWMVPLPPADDD